MVENIKDINVTALSNCEALALSEIILEIMESSCFEFSHYDPFQMDSDLFEVVNENYQDLRLLLFKIAKQKDMPFLIQTEAVFSERLNIKELYGHGEKIRKYRENIRQDFERLLSEVKEAIYTNDCSSSALEKFNLPEPIWLARQEIERVSVALEKEIESQPSDEYWEAERKKTMAFTHPIEKFNEKAEHDLEGVSGTIPIKEFNNISYSEKKKSLYFDDVEVKITPYSKKTEQTRLLNFIFTQPQSGAWLHRDEILDALEKDDDDKLKLNDLRGRINEKITDTLPSVKEFLEGNSAQIRVSPIYSDKLQVTTSH